MSQSIVLTETNRPKDIEFDEIRIGQHFIFEDEIYLRVFKGVNQVEDNAISCITGYLTSFELDTVVQLITIEEIIYSIKR